MNDSRVNQNFEKGSRKRLAKVFVGITAIAFAIRLAAAARLPVNAYESAILLRCIGNLQFSIQPVSIIEMILIKSAFFFFGPSALGARIGSVLAGSALVLLPFYLREKLGQRLAVILGMLITFEPFLLANAVQVGSNIFAILAVLFLLSALWKRNYCLSFAAFSILLFSGRGFLAASIFLTTFYFLDLRLAWSIFPTITSVKEVIGQISRQTRLIILFFFAAFILLLIIMNIDLSDIAAPSLAFSQRLDSINIHRMPNLAMPVLLISYSPVIVFFFIASVSQKRNGQRNIQLALVSLFLVLFTLLLLLQGKNGTDLVWAALPLLVGSALFVERVVHGIELGFRDPIILVILLVVLISLTLSFTQFIYQGWYGLSQVNALINISTMAFMLAFGYLAFLFFGDGTRYIKVLGLASAILLICIQLSFSFRAAGITRDTAAELLWSGNTADGQTLQSIVHTRTISRKFADDRVDIAIENHLSPQLIWIMRDIDVVSIPKNTAGPFAVDLIITEKEPLQINGAFVGQTFAANVFPKWIEQPLRSIFDYDYWSWLIFRISNKTTISNTIWYAMD